MNIDWLADGRKIPDDVMYFIRRMAVNAIRVLGQSPEKIAKPIILIVRVFTTHLNAITIQNTRLTPLRTLAVDQWRLLKDCFTRLTSHSLETGPFLTDTGQCGCAEARRASIY
ncbi:MAG: hypothetical protein Q7U66_13570 [Methylobacter sp.]|nr:hypothetical protein [Methylobacter sp.]